MNATYKDDKLHGESKTYYVELKEKYLCEDSKGVSECTRL